MKVLSRCYCWMIALCLAVTNGVLLAQPAQAGRPATAATVAGGDGLWNNCAANTGMPGAYAHCKLQLRNGNLEQGEHHDVIEEQRFLHPIDLSRHLTGAEALHYASQYHQRKVVQIAAAAFGAPMVAFGALGGYTCGRGPCPRVTSWQARRTTLYTGGALLAISIPFRISANRAAQRAFDVFNASLHR